MLVELDLMIMGAVKEVVFFFRYLQIYADILANQIWEITPSF